MSRSTRFWNKGVMPLALGGLMLTGASLRADDASISRQLNQAAREAAAQGHKAEARDFLRNALRLDPNNTEAAKQLAALGEVRLASNLMQNPTDKPAAVPGQATIDKLSASQVVRRQEFQNTIGQRMQTARMLANAGQPEAALSELRTALNSVQSFDQIDTSDRSKLEAQVRTMIGATEATLQRVELERLDAYRRFSADAARTAALGAFERDQDKVGVLMAEFDNLMAQGTFFVNSNAGSGNIDEITAPFTDARSRAVAAHAIDPDAAAPIGAMFVAKTVRFLSQSLAYDELKEYRALLTFQDVDRATVPFPDTRTIEYPKAEIFIAMTEKRRAKYGEGNETQLLNNKDPRTKAILTMLNERLTMPFPQETSLEEILKYVRSKTASEELDMPSGIPIYVDPIGLSEADVTLAKGVTIDLEGIPLKTSLRLLLKQIGLTYTVKDGLLTITNAQSDDQPTEIRVYPVADLAIIPISLMGGGGGMGGMGGGMGGMGGGMGGMGGGMGGMGGGMGGMGGGMGGMGGMMSIPPQDPSLPAGQAGGYLEKKSN